MDIQFHIEDEDSSYIDDADAALVATLVAWDLHNLLLLGGKKLRFHHRELNMSNDGAYACLHLYGSRA